MEKRRLLAIPLLILAALAGFTAGLYTQNSNIVTGNYEDHAMRIEIYIYKNGELVYYDPDDPAVTNFLLWLANEMGVDTTMTTRSGGAYNPDLPYGDFKNVLAAVADGTGPFARNMYTLPGNNYYTSVAADAITISDNYIQFSASININANTTITWVGLYGDIDNPTNWDGDEILIFADPLDNPFNVTSGDVITVVYKLVVP